MLLNQPKLTTKTAQLSIMGSSWEHNRDKGRELGNSKMEEIRIIGLPLLTNVMMM